MFRIRLAVFWLMFAAGSAPAGDVAGEVRNVFAVKCAGCHGPDLAKPKGRFGYVLDLARVASNREMVVPGAPDESELWELVRRGEMPPDDSPAGPLTADQKETIRAWIAAGAPTAPLPSAGFVGEGSGVSAAGGLNSEAPSPPAPLPQSRERGEVSKTIQRLGRLHVVLVHFPIALLIAAAAGESWSVLRGRSNPAAAVHFCVLLGTAGAVATAALGWLHALGGAGMGMPVALGLHRWLGIAAAGWAVLTAVLSIQDERYGVRSGSFRAAIIVAAMLAGAAGHFGGVLVFGEDFF